MSTAIETCILRRTHRASVASHSPSKTSTPSSPACDPWRGARRELERSEDSYRLCCVRGPEGIIVELAEQIGGRVRSAADPGPTRAT